jgi:O-antigen ligase
VIRHHAKPLVARVPVERELPHRMSEKAAPSVARQKDRVPRVIRWSFVLFIMSFPLEAIDLGFSGSLSLARIAGLPFFASYFFYYNPLSKKGPLPRIPAAMWWLVGYLVVFAVNGLLIPAELTGAFVLQLLTRIQLIVFFWISSNLLQHEKLAIYALLAFVLASTVVSGGMILELPGFTDAGTVDMQREAALGFNPNTQAGIIALSLLTTVGILLARNFNGFTINGLITATTLPLLVALVKTGSRGGILAFMAGISLYLLEIWPPKRLLTRILLITAGIAVIAYTTTANPFFLERWEVAYFEGDLAGREKIIPTAIEMISERPFFGWNPVEFNYELGGRLNAISGNKDAHDLYLHLLLEVGLVGAFPFLVGIGLCARAAWRSRAGPFGSLPLALLLAMLAGNLSGTWIDRKFLWLVLAFTVAAQICATRYHTKRSVRRSRLHDRTKARTVKLT